MMSQLQQYQDIPEEDYSKVHPVDETEEKIVQYRKDLTGEIRRLGRIALEEDRISRAVGDEKLEGMKHINDVRSRLVRLLDNLDELFPQLKPKAD